MNYKLVLAAFTCGNLKISTNEFVGRLPLYFVLIPIDSFDKFVLMTSKFIFSINEMNKKIKHINEKIWLINKIKESHNEIPETKDLTYIDLYLTEEDIMYLKLIS